MYISHRRAAKAHASQRICADSHEPSLLANTEYVYMKVHTNI